MNLSMQPVKIEIYDDGDGVAIVEAFDEHAANVTISTFVCATTWPAISELILKALKSMQLQGDDQ